MTSQHAVSSEYDARIRRAEKLIAEKSSASELLSFYKRIASFQKTFLVQISDAALEQPATRQFGSVRDLLDLTVLLPHFRNFLSLIEQNAPNALAAAAREIAALPSDSWIALLTAYWENGGRFDQQIGAFAQFFPRAFLEPYAAYVAGRRCRQCSRRPGCARCVEGGRCSGCCASRAMAGNGVWFVLSADMNGSSGGFCVRLAAKKKKRNFLFTSRNSFRTFVWSLATPVSFLFERSTSPRMGMPCRSWTTLRRFRLRFGRTSSGTPGSNQIFLAAKSSWQLNGIGRRRFLTGAR
jgi:hypothetical protein